MKLGVCVLLGAIFDAKKTGKGRIGRAKVHKQLMQIINDKDEFYLDTDPDKFFLRFLKGTTEYPYEIFKFEGFEEKFENNQNFIVYIRKMKNFCDNVLNENKLEQLVYFLLEIVRQDKSITTILYGSEFVPKEKFFGSYAHPKRICIEALLLGLLYHVHKNQNKSEYTELPKIPEKVAFHMVWYENKASLNLDITINLLENIHKNAKRRKPAKMKYSLELRREDEISTEIPDGGNVFLYGSGGTGKSTLLLNQIRKENSINLYFSLYQYKREIHEKIRSESCWILLQILLKYHYQYEYQTYETLIANEDENAVLQQFTELEQQLKNNPDNWKPSYVLLLDGMNEMPSKLQEELAVELEQIISEWKNVRIIITGRTVPMYNVFDNFQQIEVCGITDSERDAALSDFSEISSNKNLMDVLKIPMFLNMYIENRQTDKTINTRGEILDCYIMNWKVKSSERFTGGVDSSVIRFIVQYILPFAAKIMVDEYNIFHFLCNNGIGFEITRGDLLMAIGKTYDTYVLDEFIYQSYIAPKGFRKKSLLESREKFDFIELIIENIGLMKISENNPNKLYFSHQYYRDYFAAKHILNLLDVIDTSYSNSSVDEKKEAIKKFNIDKQWFIDEERDIYKLLGEICGDYKNIPDHNEIIFGGIWYKRTILDNLLDMYRTDENGLKITENVIKVMSLSRNGVICEVNFDGLFLPYIPCNIKFSKNGKYPCSFRNCIIDCLGICDTNKTLSKVSEGNGVWEEHLWEKLAFCSPDKELILIIFDDNYVLLWDNKSDKILWDIDLSEYANHIYFDCAEFSADGNIINLYTKYCTNMRKVTVDSHSGKVIECGQERLYNYNCINERFLGKYLKSQIFKQLTHFKNCDFTGVKFSSYDSSKELCLMGALTDNKIKEAVIPKSQHEIKKCINGECVDIDDIAGELKFLDESFSQMLMRKIAESGMSDSEYCKKAHVDMKLFSEIRNNVDYEPKKTTAIALVLALELSVNDTKEMLAAAGYTLTYSSKFDIIIKYFIIEGIYDIMYINEVLLKFGQTSLIK